MSNKTKFAKKGFIAVIALLLIIIMTPITQGCEYIDREAVRELFARNDALQKEYSELKEKATEQLTTIAAMQTQASGLKDEVQAAQGDTASTQEEAEGLQQQIAAKQAELDNTNQRIEEVSAELKTVRETLDTLWQASGGGGGTCFAYDTLVLMADNSLKHISDIQVGEQVQAYDVETGQTAIADVIATGNGEGDYYYLINGDLKVTPPHPFFTADGKWTKVEDLKVGDNIRSFQGQVKITSIEKVNSEQQLFNISVRYFHNFFVSANGRDFYLVKES